MRFVHTADLHLDAPVGALAQRAAIRRSGLETLREIIEYATAQQIGQVVIAGDLFDSPTPSAAMAGAVKKLFAQAPQILFLVAAGKHDPLSATGSWCLTQLPENVILFADRWQQVGVPGGTFVGVSMTEGQTAPIPQLPPQTQGITIGIVHGDPSDSEGRYRLEESAIKEWGFDYLALGHIHKPAAPRQMGKTVVANCGSPTAHGFDETGPRFFLDVTVAQGRVSCIPVQTHGICFFEQEILLNEQDSQSEILGKLMDAAAAYEDRDIFRFRLRGATAHALPLSLEEYPALVQIIDETTLPLSVEQLAKEQSLRGYFVSGMLEQMEQAEGEERGLYEAALRLGLEAFQ